MFEQLDKIAFQARRAVSLVMLFVVVVYLLIISFLVLITAGPIFLIGALIHPGKIPEKEGI